MKHKMTFNLRVLLFQEDKTWVAQCLEWDIAAQGKTLDDALNSFEQTFVGQIVLDIEGGRKPLASTPRSPKEYQGMFKKAKKLVDKKPLYIPKELFPTIGAATAEDLRIAA